MIRLVFIFVFLAICCACGRSTGEIVQLIEERDSLKTVASRQDRYIENVDQLMGLINSGLDSIASQEQLIYPTIGETGVSKDNILSKLDGVAKLINQQKDKIESLESKINKDLEQADEKSNIQLHQTIERFKNQLAQKDLEISKLKEELSKKDVDLANMQKQLTSYSSKIADLDRKNTLQAEALQRQDKMLNQCYMIIASKDDLIKAGIVKKGKLIAQGALDRSKFSQVDIRKFSEMQFEAKRPRILTQMPENSYYVVTNGKNHYTLKITNPSDFWKVSNYLVIQTD